MSDAEEPPTKTSKYTDFQYLDEDELDEGMEDTLEDAQEEWLSEGVLTDDDYNPVAEKVKQEHGDSTSSIGEVSQGKLEVLPMRKPTAPNATTTSLAHIIHTTKASSITIANSTVTRIPVEYSIAENSVPATADPKAVPTTTNIPTITIVPMVIASEESERPESGSTKNIEDTLNDLEGNMKEHPATDMEKFLIRKSEGEILEPKDKDEITSEVKEKHESDDDGNDTDDLLRMLGDDGDKRKKTTFKLMKVDKFKDEASTDDDEFVYEKSRMKTFKVAKNAVLTRPATRAEPEDSSDDDVTDASSDEAQTMGKIFGTANSGLKRTQANSGPKTTPVHSGPKSTQAKGTAEVQKIIRLNSSQAPSNRKTSTPQNQTLVKQNSSKQKSILKPMTPAKKPDALPPKSLSHLKSLEVKTPTLFKPLDKKTPKSATKSDLKMEADEIINEEEFLEEDGFNLDEQEFAEDSDDGSQHRGTLRRPERMDEDWPSDADSPSEGGSLYDELPSSDSEDMGTWFSLDIRAERATDYLPLLGSKAHELLSAERARVGKHVSALQRTLSTLTRSARQQADELRAAAMALAEVDDTLRAT